MSADDALRFRLRTGAGVVIAVLWSALAVWFATSGRAGSGVGAVCWS